MVLKVGVLEKEKSKIVRLRMTKKHTVEPQLQNWIILRASQSNRHVIGVPAAMIIGARHDLYCCVPIVIMFELLSSW